MTIGEREAKKLYNKLSEVPGFKGNFPRLMECLRRKEVYTWDNRAITGEPDAIDVRRIFNMELKGQHVYAVLDNYSCLGGTATVHMKSYLFICDDDDCYINEYDSTTYYALADVYNESWDIHEMGDVLISRSIAGGPRRIG